jgi:hypothetical protein
MTFESPLTGYCSALAKAPRAEQLAALAALRPLVEAAARRTGVRLDARGALRVPARGAGKPQPGYDSSDDEEEAAAAAGQASAASLRAAAGCSAPAPGQAGATAGAAAPTFSDGDADVMPDAAPEAYTACFPEGLCGLRSAAAGSDPSAPPAMGDALSAWASDVGVVAAQAVSSALAAGSTVVMPACACPAAARRTGSSGLMDAVREGVNAGGVTGMPDGGAGSAAVAAAIGPGPADAAPSAASGVRWGDAPERVCAALAVLAPGLFADVAGLALAPLACTLNHSCVPNCQLDTTPAGQLTAVTLNDVAEGEELTIAYTATAVPLVVRRAELAKHAFECACARCALEAGGAAALRALPPAEVHALARQAQEEGRYNDAERMLRALLARPAAATAAGVPAAPDASAAHALGVCLLASGRWAEAHDTWAAAARRAPMHAALKAQAEKDACYWPAPEAPMQRSLRDEEVTPTVDDIYCIPVGPNEERDVAYITRVPLLTAQDCARAVAAAEETAACMGGWATQRHYAVPTTDIPLHEVPSLQAWFNEALRGVIAPLLVAAYPEIGAPGRVRVHDAFIVRYAAAQQRHLPVHQDQSMYSLTIALNPRAQFTGGGTFFESGRTVICPDVGHIVAFTGDSRHGAEPITAGVRYIIACFLFVGSEDAKAEDVPEAADF